MIEYSVCICYGMVISDEIAEQLRLNWDENYYEEYVRCIDAWTCDKGWFFGITESIVLEDNPIILLNNISIPKFKINKFERIVYEEGLEESINWDPKYYIINFCY